MRPILLLPLFILVGCIPNRSTHAQISWDEPLSVAGPEYDNNYPRIVTDGSGAPLLVWNDGEQVFFARWGGSGFTSPIRINPDSVPAAGASWMGPDLAAHGDTVYIVYKEKPEAEANSHIRCVSSYDGGITFSDPVRVDYIGENLSRFPVVTTDDMGHPLVAYMKFDAGFHNGQWVMTTSNDGGKSFSSEVQASGWSSPAAEVCDCCPGAIASAGNHVAVIYRDNNSNIRDNWTGLSSDGGTTFERGMNIDQKKWMLNQCPASGPDGVIVGDTLYATFMNGAGGTTRSYYNKIPVSASSTTGGRPITGDIPGLSRQNFARIDAAGKALAVVWKQYIGIQSQLPVLFTEDITRGFPLEWDTVTTDVFDHPDLSLSEDHVYVVWQDFGSGSVKFRAGTYGSPTDVDETEPEKILSVYPNPSASKWNIRGQIKAGELLLTLYDTKGRQVFTETLDHPGGHLRYFIDNAHLGSGLYYLRLSDARREYTLRLIKD